MIVDKLRCCYKVNAKSNIVWVKCSVISHTVFHVKNHGK